MQNEKLVEKFEASYKRAREHTLAMKGKHAPFESGGKIPPRQLIEELAVAQGRESALKEALDIVKSAFPTPKEAKAV